MSLFSYISFPREVDKSCLQSNFNSSKSFKVSEIRGTELAFRFEGNLDEMPDDLNVYFGDMTDFHGIQINEIDSETFENVFENQYIYCFQGRLDFLDKEKYFQDCMKIFYNCDENERENQSQAEWIEMLNKNIKEAHAHADLCRRQLFDLTQLNLRSGEKIEIYSEWISGRIGNFGTYEHKVVLASNQILTSEQLVLEDKMKIEIIRVT